MTAIPENTVGGQVKLGAMKTEHAEKLARAIFDGKRELPIAGKRVVTPDFTKLTAHERIILTGLFLKAEVRAA